MRRNRLRRQRNCRLHHRSLRLRASRRYVCLHGLLRLLNSMSERLLCRLRGSYLRLPADEGERSGGVSNRGRVRGCLLPERFPKNLSEQRLRLHAYDNAALIDESAKKR
jgi:hypothetical protein